MVMLNPGLLLRFSELFTTPARELFREDIVSCCKVKRVQGEDGSIYEASQYS